MLENEVRAHRMRLGWSQEELAKPVGGVAGGDQRDRDGPAGAVNGGGAGAGGGVAMSGGVALPAGGDAAGGES